LKIAGRADSGNLRVKPCREEKLKLNTAICRITIDLHGTEILIGVEQRW
jgi:hypothetical protein